jgi:hypothetical protein
MIRVSFLGASSLCGASIGSNLIMPINAPPISVIALMPKCTNGFITSQLCFQVSARFCLGLYFTGWFVMAIIFTKSLAITRPKFFMMQVILGFHYFMNHYATFFLNVITVISGHIPSLPEKARKPKPRFTYR